MNEPMWKSIIADSVKAEKSRQEEAAKTQEKKYYNSMTEDEELEAEVTRRRLEAERKRAARKRAEQIRIRQNRIIAFCALVTVIMIIISVVVYRHQVNSTKAAESSSAVSAEAKSKTKKTDSKAESSSQAEQKEQESTHKIEQNNGMTFVDDILIVNKTYSLPADYDPGVSQVALNAFNEMAEAAAADGISLWINSGYRSYQEQEELYNGYASERGTDSADEVSSRPGHSEHQTGLAFDVNDTSFSFENSPEADWLAEHCPEYGFIIRFPDGKEKYTGYTYEPWHIRYLGTKLAEEITKSGLSLEEYLDITSEYAE
ncbi:MAG: D-alanyl-D-alanine carboxypeptidase family protein [Ruminococcus sp.]|nr:D-alanyl-D-alanine carboxypeptidase family protein [Ruminococcus sp.]